MRRRDLPIVLGLVLVAVTVGVLAYVVYDNRDVGRYVPGPTAQVLIDTKTGRVYVNEHGSVLGRWELQMNGPNDKRYGF